MSKYSNTIEYKLRTTLDDTGISKLQAELRATAGEIQRLQSMEFVDNKQAQEAINRIQKIENALIKAFNPKMGMLDTKVFTRDLQKVGVTIQTMSQDFKMAGATGQIALNSMVGRLGKVDTGLKAISRTTDKVFNTIGNTVRWGITASAFQGIMNSLHDSINYVKELDQSLTDIMMVTDYNKQEMNEYAKSANEAAKALGAVTTAQTNATLVFAQQGFDLDTSAELATRSTKLANASQQETSVTSDQITAMMNAYGIENDIARIDEALDSWAEVANVSAADVQEIAVGFSKAGSTAATVGVSMDQLNAQIAAIESVTREAPENIGNGLKTLYARFADIQMGETLDDGVSLGDVTGTLEAVGVQVLNAEGKMNSVGDIMEDLMDVWQQLDTTQKNAIATTLAGKYQLSRFEALMNRSDLYKSYKESSENAEGTLDEMNDKYVNSLAGRMNSLQASFEGIVNDVLNTDDFYDIIGALQETIELFDDLIDSIGGGGQALTAFGTIATRVFSKNLAAGVNNVMSNLSMNQKRADNVKYNEYMLQQLGASDAVLNSERSQSLLDFAKNNTKFDASLTNEQLEERNKLLQKSVDAENLLVEKEAELAERAKATNAAYKMAGITEKDVVVKRDDGTYDASGMDKAYSNALRILEEHGIDAPKKINLSSLQDNAFLEDNIGQLQILIQELNKAEQSTMDFAEAEKVLNGLLRENIDETKLDDTALDNLHGQQGTIKVMYKDLVVAHKKWTEALNTKDEEAQTAALRELKEAALEYLGVTDRMAHMANKSQGAYTQSQQVEGTNEEYLRISAGANALQSEREWSDDSAANQQRIQGFIDTTAAIGQMAFAWESFQNLGSIWNNEDLTLGEKIGQTILNLTMTLPMAVTGFQQLQKAIQTANVAEKILLVSQEKRATGNIKMLAAQKIEAAQIRLTTQAAELEAKADLQGAAALQIKANKAKKVSAALREQAIAEQEATIGAKMLSSAMSGLAGPLGIALGVILAVGSALYGAWEQGIKDAIEAEKELADSTIESTDKLVEQYRTWEKGAKHYKNTGEATEEFKTQTLEMAETLDIAGAKILAQAEQWDILTSAIIRAKDAELDKAKNSLDDTLHGKTYNDLMGNNTVSIVNDNAKGKANSVFNTATGYDLFGIQGAGNLFSFQDTEGNILNKGALTVSELNNTFKNFNDIAENDLAGVVRRYKENIEAADEALEELEKEVPESERDAEWQERYDNLYEARASFIEGLNEESLKNWNDALAAKAVYQIQDSKIQEQLEGLSSTEEILEKLSKDPVIGEFFKTLTTDEEKLAWVLENVNDELTNEKLQLDQISKEFAKNYQGGLYKKEANGEYLEGRDGAEIVSAIKNSKLTEDEQIVLYGMLDESKTAQQINQAIDMLEQGESLEAIEIVLQPEVSLEKLREEANYSSEELKDILEEANIDNATYQEYKNKLLEDEVDLHNEIINNEKEVNELTKERDKYDVHSDEWDKLNTQLQEAVKHGEELDQTLSDLTAQIIETQNGLNDLAEVTDDQFKALAKGDEYSQDYITGLKQIRESMAQVLNVEPEDISSDFLKQYLEDIKALAEGDLEAIDRLRSALAVDVASGLNIDWNLTDLNSEQFNEMLTSFSSEIEGLEIGTSLDDTAFIEALNEMVEQGAIKIEDVQKILNQLNMDYDIKYKPMDVPQVDYKASFQAKVDSGDGSLGSLISAAASTISEFQADVSYQTVDMPYIANASVGGAGSGSGRKSGTKLTSPPRKDQSGKKNNNKAAEPKTKDHDDSKPDRYQKVNEALSRTSEELGRVEKAQDRLAGKDWTKNVQKQIKYLEKEIDLQHQKLKLQEQERKELQNSLNSQGVKFDPKTGAMTNYNSAYKKNQAKYNAAVDRYNKSSAEEQKKAEAEGGWFWQAQKDWDDFKTNVSRYDSLQDEIQQSLNAIDDFTDKIEDLRIEALKTSIAVVKNFKEMNEAMITFNRSIRNIASLRDDNPFDDLADSAARLSHFTDTASKSADAYYDKQIAAAKKNGNTALAKVYQQAKANNKDGYFGMTQANMDVMMQQYNQWKASGSSSIFGENSAEMFEVMEEVLQQGQEMVNEAAQELLDMKKALLSAIDEMDKKMQKHNQQYQDLIDRLEYFNDMNKLVTGDENYATENAIIDQKIANRNEQVILRRQEIEAWKKDLATATDEDVIDSIKEKIKTAENEINDLLKANLEDVNQKLLNSVKMYSKAWEKAIFQIKPKMESVVNSGRGQLGSALDNNLYDKNGNAVNKNLDWMATEWELINRNADYYLDDVNAAYETQKLQNKYLDLLDDASESSLGIQNKITEQMKEQLDYLRNKEKLSEYDVAYAQAQLEILQKTIALEEARNAKKQMRLRRDSQGNYRYQYVANEEDTRDAENDLLDAQNNAYNLSKEQMKQTQADALSALQNAQNVINNIMSNTNETLEERQAKAKVILDKLKEYIKGTSEQLSTSEKHIVDDFVGMMEILTEENERQLGTIYEGVLNGQEDMFDQIDTRWSTSLADWLFNTQEFNDACDQLYANLIAAGDAWTEGVNNQTTLARKDWTDTTTEINNCKDALQGLINSNAEFIKTINEDAGSISNYNQQLENYKNKVKQLTDAQTEYLKRIKELEDALEKKNAEEAVASDKVTPNSGETNAEKTAREKKIAADQAAKQKQSTSDNGLLSKGTTVKLKSGHYYHSDSYGSGPHGNWADATKVSHTNAGAPYPIHLTNAKGDWRGWVKKSDLVGYDTGGYTGTWNEKDKETKNGKLALLHQKELVLNASDTENILKAVESVRALTDAFKSGAIGMVQSLVNQKIPVSKTQQLDQQIHIEAEFPNVQDSREIEIALLDLINQTPQYALKTR